MEERAERGVPVHPADVAHHFTAAISKGEAERAARWALAAASAEVEALAFGEAAGHLRRWRDALPRSTEVVDPRVHTAVLLAEADALVSGRDDPRGAETGCGRQRASPWPDRSPTYGARSP